MLTPTRRLYWADDHLMTATATILDVRGGCVALDQTCFYGGGGGQPPDHGTISTDGVTVEVTDINCDAEGVLWHACSPSPDASWIGRCAKLSVNSERRIALSRYHTVLHLVNTIALRDYGAWITGAHIDETYARIDFKWEGFSSAVCTDVEQKVNLEVSAGHSIRAFTLSESEFSERPELLRTLEVRPPVVNGLVRVVAIDGFDAQACGGTHVSTTSEIGTFSIERTENKGRINKRLYVRLK